jgi:HPt (histidine-containing phosphotransfer) domain-containing protein
MTNDGQSSTPRPELEVKGVCAPEEAIVRLAGYRDLYADTVVSFFQEAGKFVGQIGEAIAAGDTTTMRKTAHGLKGFAGMCGAVSVAEAAAALEKCEEASTVEDRKGLLARLEGEVAVAQTTLRPFTVPK